MAKKTGTPREYTMPNKYEGGYSTYNPTADRLANAELIGNDIQSLKAKREKIQNELDELKIKRHNFDILSVNVPEATAEDKENIQAQQFRAGAEAMMEYDPATAQSWLLRADEIEARKQDRAQKLESKNAIFTPGTKEWVNWMTGMLKQKTFEAGLYTGQARSDLLNESANIKKSLAKYPLGRSALGIAEPTEPTGPTGQPEPITQSVVKSAAMWLSDINAVNKSTPNWESVLATYKTDIATAKTNKEIGDAEATDLNDKIDKKIGEIRMEVKAPAIAAAKKKAEAKQWLEEFLTTMRLDDLIKNVRAARATLNSIISEVKAGHYANANLKPFKETMGNMSGDEYGIATDSPAADMVGSIPLVGEGIATWIASDKFNDEESAYDRTNAAIDSFNQLIDLYIGENLIPAYNSTPERIAALNDSPIVVGLRNALGSKISKIYKGGGTNNPAVNPVQAKPAITTKSQYNGTERVIQVNGTWVRTTNMKFDPKTKTWK